MSALPKQRFIALDIFRGITIAFMIMVNNAGPHSFNEMRHADWHGFTLTDLVWPSFLFVMGAAMAYTKERWNKMSQKEVVVKILKRTFLIFLIGYLMYWFPFFDYDADGVFQFRPISHTRILGVLQRIALCYGIAALLVYYTGLRTIIISSVVILLAYWIAMAGYGNLDSKTGNLQSVIDMAALTPNHMYRMGKEGYDACGILGTFPAVVNTLAGFVCAWFIKNKPKGFETLAKVAMAGFACLAIAYLWNLVFPYNKKIWTSSYVMLTIGIDCLIFVCLIYITDFIGHVKWANFFNVFGKNPLFIYVLSELIPRFFGAISTPEGKSVWSKLYTNIFAAGLGNGLLASLLYCMFLMFVYWLAAWWMDKKKIYVKL